MEQSPHKRPQRAREALLRITGFSALKNILLWFVFAGALIGFCLARIAYLDVDGVYQHNAGPGECFYFRQPLYKAGLKAHLAAAIPMGLLVVSQFLPAIRHRWIIVHRIARTRELEASAWSEISADPSQSRSATYVSACYW